MSISHLFEALRDLRAYVGAKVPKSAIELILLYEKNKKPEK
jgi:hypothetical protein